MLNSIRAVPGQCCHVKACQILFYTGVKSKSLLTVMEEGSPRPSTLPVLGGWEDGGVAQCTDNLDCVRETEIGRQSCECSITSHRACHRIPSLSLSTEGPFRTGLVGSGWVGTGKDQAEGEPSPVNTRRELRTGTGWSCCGWWT